MVTISKCSKESSRAEMTRVWTIESGHLGSGGFYSLYLLVALHVILLNFSESQTPKLYKWTGSLEDFCEV